MRRNLVGWLAGTLLLGVATADTPTQRRPLFVNHPILPSWLPLWDWERPHSFDGSHRVLEQLTGIGGVGQCCVEGITHDGHLAHLCFAPGTPEWYVEYMSRLIFGEFMPAYNLGNRWTFTSYGSTGSRGTPIRLRWSLVPDGTQLPGPGNNTLPSNLFSSMDNKFGGNRGLWLAQFRNSFARWQQVAGITYTEVSDDGASFPNAPGSATVPRGDVRIGARNLDGPSGILAFNYFPNVGDMVLDSSESWQNAFASYRFLRNTVMHEHGHGLGLGHVIPVNETKLMEPYLSLAFDGPQDDDIRGAHRLYGDPYEVNNTQAQATPVELPEATVTLEWASLDRSADVDWYRLEVPAFRRLTITAAPIGATYQVGPEGGTASTINTRAIQNLDMELCNSTGTVIATANSNGIGQSEQIANFVPPPAGGTFFVRVFSGTGSADDVQRYRLTVQQVVLPTGDMDGNGCVNNADLLLVLFNFGTNNPAADGNGDGVVNNADLLLVLFNFGQGC
ncbi:MAG: matrixin family metalloprotease [Fimbriimonadales bacterium]|nr:matrixin family metalloprotease [Fimbriimonadales bacterium]MDW8051172.1 matrixin family metalloprotease [Armatimonadota bacterium]